MGMDRRTKILVWLLLSVAAVGAVCWLEPIAQDPRYHRFADGRSWLGIPNFADVSSNLGFCLVGALGLGRLGRSPRQAWSLQRIERDLPRVALFAGLCLTGVGSGYYHGHPDNARLVWDRLPMTVVFLSLLALVISERIDRRLGFCLEFPLLGLGVASVWYWHWTESLGRGDLRPYGLAQFYPPFGILLLLVLFPARLDTLASWGLAAVFYTLAKVFEWQDASVFQTTGCVSGHTLKHLMATAAACFIYRIWADPAETAGMPQAEQHAAARPPGGSR